MRCAYWDHSPSCPAAVHLCYCCRPTLHQTTGENINTRLALVMKSGKAFLGYSQTLKSLRKGKCT